jgi:citronellol/citronellal dehydrogenase
MAMIPGTEDAKNKFRKVSIMADAAYTILCQDAKVYTGNFTIDEDVIKSQGITNLDVYANVPGTTDFFPDFFVPDEHEFFWPPKRVLKKATSKL